MLAHMPGCPGRTCAYTTQEERCTSSSRREAGRVHFYVHFLPWRPPAVRVVQAVRKEEKEGGGGGPPQLPKRQFGFSAVVEGRIHLRSLLSRVAETCFVRLRFLAKRAQSSLSGYYFYLHSTHPASRIYRIYLLSPVPRRALRLPGGGEVGLRRRQRSPAVPAHIYLPTTYT